MIIITCVGGGRARELGTYAKWVWVDNRQTYWLDMQADGDRHTAGVQTEDTRLGTRWAPRPGGGREGEGGSGGPPTLRPVHLSQG